MLWDTGSTYTMLWQHDLDMIAYADGALGNEERGVVPVGCVQTRAYTGATEIHNVCLLQAAIMTNKNTMLSDDWANIQVLVMPGRKPHHGRRLSGPWPRYKLFAVNVPTGQANLLLTNEKKGLSKMPFREMDINKNMQVPTDIPENRGPLITHPREEEEPWPIGPSGMFSEETDQYLYSIRTPTPPLPPALAGQNDQLLESLQSPSPPPTEEEEAELGPQQLFPPLPPGRTGEALRMWEWEQDLNRMQQQAETEKEHWQQVEEAREAEYAAILRQVEADKEQAEAKWDEIRREGQKERIDFGKKRKRALTEQERADIDRQEHEADMSRQQKAARQLWDRLGIAYKELETKRRQTEQEFASRRELAVREAASVDDNALIAEIDSERAEADAKLNMWNRDLNRLYDQGRIQWRRAQHRWLAWKEAQQTQQTQQMQMGGEAAQGEMAEHSAQQTQQTQQVQTGGEAAQGEFHEDSRRAMNVLADQYSEGLTELDDPYKDSPREEAEDTINWMDWMEDPDMQRLTEDIDIFHQNLRP